jgi:hypothetical protein
VRPASNTAGWAAVAIFAVVAAGGLLPLTPAYVSYRLDDSFAATLHFAAATRGAGTRLISTFGPLGFVFHDFYYPATYAWMFAMQVVLAAVICWTLGWIGWAALESPWGAAVTIGACAPFIGSPDVRYLMLPVLALLVELPRRTGAPAALRVAIGFAVGIVSLVKVTFLIAALTVLAPLALVDVLGGRVPLTIIAACATGAILWRASGQGWADLVAYLDWSLWEITPGYASAMQLPTGLPLLAHVALVSAALLGIAVLLARRRWPRGWYVPALALAGALFLLFKAGFVRADVHIFITCFALAVIGVLLAVLVVGTSRGWVVAALVMVAALPGGLLWHALRAHGEPTTVFRAILPLEAADRLRLLPGVLWGGRNASSHTNHTELTKSLVPLPALSGPVDIYSYLQGTVIANGLDFRPRPVFQSYMAYTPRLSRANAEFLLSDRAPQWILFQPATIDVRLPALDDALSWPLFFTHYRLAGQIPELAVLQRRDVPLHWGLTPLGTVQTATGTRVAVPAASEGPIWARIDLQQTLRDRIVTTLLAAPLVFMDVTLSDGRHSRYSLIADLAREGFLLSPLITTADQFAQLLHAEPQSTGGDVTSLSVHVDRAHGIDPAPRMLAVRFFRLRIEGHAVASSIPP